jgi:hypothetical protein
MTEGHARVKLKEVKRHLDAAYFAWIGGTDAAGVFIIASTAPWCSSSSATNDYGKDLLRQHYLQRTGDKNCSRRSSTTLRSSRGIVIDRGDDYAKPPCITTVTKHSALSLIAGICSARSGEASAFDRKQSSREP